MELAKGPERGPLSACIDMPLPLCKYLLTSLKFSCICGKILLSVCVFLLSSFGDALPACQGTDEHIWSADCFPGKRQLGLSPGLYQTWVCLSLGSSPIGECSLAVLACFDGLVVQTCSAEVQGSHNTRFAAAFL